MRKQILNVINSIRSRMSDIKGSQAEEISSLSSILLSMDPVEAEELLDQELDNLKGFYAAQAANHGKDAEAEQNINMVEYWISENVANQSLEDRVAAALIINDSRTLQNSWSRATQSA